MVRWRGVYTWKINWEVLHENENDEVNGFISSRKTVI